jgi:hypothetical protein
MLFQLLQSLNLMDYSLLVGIHDSTIPAGEMSDFEDFSDDESGEEYTDLPLSPSNTGVLAQLLSIFLMNIVSVYPARPPLARQPLHLSAAQPRPFMGGVPN